MDDFVHNTDHLLFVGQDIGSRSDILGTQDDLTNNRSSSTRSFRASSSTGNIVAGVVSFDHEDPIGIDTILEDRGSSSTTDGAGRDLQLSSSGVLALKRSREVVHDGRDKRVLDVVSYRATSRAEETIVAISSEVAVTGEGSAFMVITFRVEVFFDIFDSGFLMILFIVSTLVFEGLSESEETDNDN